MNLQEFLVELKAINRNWERGREPSALRCATGDCPIAALGKSKQIPYSDNFTWGAVATKIGLSILQAREIVAAADLTYVDYSHFKGCKNCAKKDMDILHTRALLEDTLLYARAN